MAHINSFPLAVKIYKTQDADSSLHSTRLICFLQTHRVNIDWMSLFLNFSIYPLSLALYRFPFHRKSKLTNKTQSHPMRYRNACAFVYIWMQCSRFSYSSSRIEYIFTRLYVVGCRYSPFFRFESVIIELELILRKIEFTYLSVLHVGFGCVCASLSFSVCLAHVNTVISLHFEHKCIQVVKRSNQNHRIDEWTNERALAITRHNKIEEK